MAEVIKMRTYDGVIVEVDSKVAKYFSKITKYPESIVGGAEIMIQLPTRSDIFNKIVTWVTFHLQNDPPAQKLALEKMSSGASVWTPRCKVYLIDWVEVGKWDADFLKNMDVEVLTAMLQAAEFLGVKGLVGIIVKTIAKLDCTNNQIDVDCGEVEDQLRCLKLNEEEL